MEETKIKRSTAFGKLIQPDCTWVGSLGLGKAYLLGFFSCDQTKIRKKGSLCHISSSLTVSFILSYLGGGGIQESCVNLGKTKHFRYPSIQPVWLILGLLNVPCMPTKYQVYDMAFYTFFSNLNVQIYLDLYFLGIGIFKWRWFLNHFDWIKHAINIE